MRISIPPSVPYPVVHFDQDGHPSIARNAQELSEAYEDGMWDEIESAFDADNMRYDVEVEYLPHARHAQRVEDSVAFVPRKVDFDGLLHRLRDAVKQHVNSGIFRRRRPTVEQEEQVDSMSFAELISWIDHHLNS